MKKQTITQGALILISTGFITQVILNLMNQIIITRLLGEEGMGIYVLILPTLTFLTAVSSVGFSTAIPTLISNTNSHRTRVLFVVFILGMFMSIGLSFILFTLARPLAIILLRDERTFLPLLSIIPLLFCLSLSGILKAYFQSKHRLGPSSIALISSQLIRVITSYFFIQAMIPYGIVYGVIAVIFSAIASELTAIIVLLSILLKHKHQRAAFKSIPLNPQNFKDVIRVSLPTTGNRVIIAFTTFLEPIIVIQSLFTIGYTSELSGKLYSAISGFTLPVLLIPSFISSSITQSITPSIVRAYKEQDYPLIHRHLNLTFKTIFIAHGLYTLFVMLYPVEIMNLMFNTSTGSEHLLFLAPFFLLFFFQSFIAAILPAVGGTTLVLISTCFSSFVKILLMIILLPNPKLSIQGFIFAIAIQTVILTLWQYFMLKKKIKYIPNYLSLLNGLLILGITFFIASHFILSLVFTGHTVLNMVIQMGLISALYFNLSYLCRLVPKRH